MGLDSNFGAPSQRPGVCTSTTRPASPFTGQIIFETDTNRLAVYNGSSWIMLADADTPSGLELIKTQTVGSAVSSVTVSDVFSSTYDNYRIIMRFNSSSSTASHLMQLSGTTSSNYLTSGFYQSWGAAAMTAYSPGFSTTWVLSANNTSTAATDIVMDVFSPFSSVRTQGTVNAAAGNGTLDAIVLENTTNSSTGFIISKSGDTMTGGTIRVYGYRNS